MARERYGCKQKDFAAIITFIVDAFIKHIAAFASKYPHLTLAYANAIKAALVVAQNLPDVTARRSGNGSLRESLEGLNDEVRLQFGFLQDYIEAAFPDSYKTMWNLAGWVYFKKGPKQWNFTEQMCINMVAFVSANAAFLISNGGMPAGFEANLLLLVADFRAKRSGYISAKGEVQVGTENKVDAYNAIFDDVKPICRAALRVGLSPTEEKCFDFKYVTELISGNKESGFEGVVVSFATGLPIRGAVIKVGALTIITDSKGRYRVSLGKGRHYGLVSAPAPSVGLPYADQMVVFLVKKGTVSTLNIQMLQ